MYLHFTYFTQCRQAWHIHLQFKNIINTVHAVGPAIDVVRRHYGVNHLHEPGRSLDYSSDSSFSHRCDGRNFVAISDIRTIAFIRVDYGVSRPEVLPCRCKGMREYVRKPPPFPLARDTAGARECGAI